MSERWKMNRIGFVNFWLYDNESFTFEDGKLLLRGQNGSGKSITTQSFIPFILDGDRTPSRLDPFGSGDRKMEYYFLGEDDREESTGYLYLEFCKPSEKAYRTIAIGQTAHRGRPMSFWGFLVLDNRRIGKEISLYRKSGDKIIPLSRMEMKKELGEEETVRFTTSQKEYKAMVNKYLFDFENIDQYEQFIRLLIKVRAPKLSKEFKPTKVYEILNDSLQVLGDEDLRPMVDAMEKMDAIQENLEGLKRAYGDASIILKEYVHYNRYMLSRKAHTYLEAEEESQKLEKEYADQLESVRRWKERLQKLQGTVQQLENEEISISNDLQELMDPELENLDVRMQNARISLKEAQSGKQNKEKQIEQKNEQVYEAEKEIRSLRDRIEYTDRKIEECLSTLDTLQQEMQCDFHTSLRQTTDGIDKELLRSQLSVLKDRVQKGRNLLENTKRYQIQYERIQKKQESIAKEFERKEQEYSEIEKRKETEQDALITSVTSLKGNTCWKVDADTVKKAVQVLEEYTNMEDSLRLQEVLKRDYDEKVQSVNESLAVSRANQKQIRLSIREKEEEYRNIEKQKEVEPKRSEEAMASRALLASSSIQAYPFYQTVEFSEDLSIQQQAVLEQELVQAGILDALVVSEEGYARIQKEYPALLDTLLYVPQENGISFTDLKVDASLPKEIQKSVRAILSSFSNQEGKLILKRDGYFKHGLIEGHALKKESEYIGVNARRHRKQQILKSILEEIENLKSDLQATVDEIQEELQTKSVMETEYTSVRTTKVLNSFLTTLHALQLEMKELQKAKQNAEEEAGEAYTVYKEAERRMLAICTALPYKRSVETYDMILSDIDEYRDQCADLCSHYDSRETSVSYEKIQEEIRDRALGEIDTLSLEKDRFQNKMELLQKQIDEIQKIMNTPEIQEKSRKLQELRFRQQENRQNQEKLRQEMAVVEHDLEGSNANLEVQKERVDEKHIYLNYVRQYFAEELSLGFVMQKEENALSQCARKAVAQQEASYATKSSNDMFANLFNVFQKNNSNLSNYNTTIERYFDVETEVPNVERMRLVITSVWSGKKLFLNDFVQELQHTIEMQEELIREKDRELFEDILSQTISRKLTDRIEDSRKWVKAMSDLMKQMDTSMGMHFSLDWKPRNPEGDEMNVRELEKILTKDTALISAEDETRVSKHFRVIIQKEKQKQEMNNEIPNYMDLVRNALDYRKWYEFRMSYIRRNEGRKDLTNAAFNRFSGGEKAMAMYVPLFAAVNAQYQKAHLKDHPRMIALDEAFAGVDEKNISSMFEMVESLDFDYIMNSQALWGCYETVRNLRISELLRPLNQKYVTVINYTWNGKEKVMNEQ